MRTQCRHHAGELVGQWRLAALLGRGGNGEVWEARHGPSERPFALKILRPCHPRSEPFRRFCREVAAVRELQEQPRGEDGGARPAILPILDAHLPASLREGFAWYVTPVATPIRQALQDATIPDVVAATRSIADTLTFLVARGLHHRDVKPENLFRHEGRFVVGDFGLVKRTRERGTRLTRDDRVPGPFAYLPSEAFLGLDAPQWERIDVYCLAKTLWALITGSARPPLGHIVAHGKYALGPTIEARQPRLAQTWLFSEMTRYLDAVIDMATNDDPWSRPTMDEFEYLLGRALEGDKAQWKEISLERHRYAPLRHRRDTRVMSWLIARWRSDRPSDHDPISVQAEAPILGLSGGELQESLERLYSAPFGERHGDLLGDLRDGWADVRPVRWRLDEAAGGSELMEARILRLLREIEDHRPDRIAVRLQQPNVHIGGLSLPPVEASRLLDYGGDSGLLVFSRQRASDGLVFERPTVTDLARTVLRSAGDPLAGGRSEGLNPAVKQH